MFIFGHSLIDHRPPATETPSDETTVPHWIYLLAQHANHNYAAGGQYGFLQQHANLPPFSQWGYDIVPGVWDSDFMSFQEAKINSTMITAGNFIQYQGPELPYEDPNNTDQFSPISATEIIVDWLGENTVDGNIYIYENWPDMAGFIAGEGFPASASEFTAYNDYTRNAFHEWWIAYQDALLESRSEANVRMIPVGPILADLLDGLLADIPFEDLYEDNAPHGKPNIYFLAGLISYMAVYEEKAPADFEVPDLIHSEISEHYVKVVNFIWDYLIAFNTGSGESRVFTSVPSSLQDWPQHEMERMVIFPNPSIDKIHIEIDEEIMNVEVRNTLGQLLIEQNGLQLNLVNVKSLQAGQYLILVQTKSGHIHNASFIKLE
ncbi:hypothetical protein GCM10007940_02390 [Portibacter lacus]|uniref:Secretion system C-terminal sorting domain-containing protein n=2 Tax=Portibacter lacus TaxID=1099794 RepID=A0AA37SM68_9BACT|nr:hypothetical protein GCM10007940_02390 [Portibacter lacus]